MKRTAVHQMRPTRQREMITPLHDRTTRRIHDNRKTQNPHALTRSTTLWQYHDSRAGLFLSLCLALRMSTKPTDRHEVDCETTDIL